MSITAINLLHERRTSSEKHTCLGADSRARRDQGWTTSCTAHARLRHVVWDGQTKPETDEGAGVVAFVAIEVRGSPLVRDRVVKSAIAVNVCCRDSAGEQRLVQRKLCGNIVITPVRPAH